LYILADPGKKNGAQLKRGLSGACLVGRRVWNRAGKKTTSNLTRMGVNHSARSLRDAASDNERLRLLLGSPPYRHLCDDSEEHGEVLRASADFMSAVHRVRWLGR
jgi:hypothetical protein